MIALATDFPGTPPGLPNAECSQALDPVWAINARGSPHASALQVSNSVKLAPVLSGSQSYRHDHPLWPASGGVSRAAGADS
jgi:hypothetical protein